MVARTAKLERLDAAPDAFSLFVVTGSGVFLHMDDEESKASFYSRMGDNERKEQGNFKREDVICASGVACWGMMDYQQVLLDLAVEHSCEINRVGERFAEVRVPVCDEDALNGWHYHPWLGCFAPREGARRESFEQQFSRFYN